MIEKKTKVVFVTDDGVEHLSESDAVFHEYYHRFSKGTSQPVYYGTIATTETGTSSLAPEKS